MIQSLADQISSYEELRSLAINGLGLEAVKVQKHKKKDITTAAFDLVMEWRNSQNDRQSAHKELYNGLKNSNLELYIGMVLKPKDKKSSKSSSDEKINNKNAKVLKRLRKRPRKR